MTYGLDHTCTYEPCSSSSGHVVLAVPQLRVRNCALPLNVVHVPQLVHLPHTGWAFLVRGLDACRRKTSLVRVKGEFTVKISNLKSRVDLI